MHWCFEHWLEIISILTFVFIGLPIVSPILIGLGFPNAGRILFWLYAPLCHQLPERSFFVLDNQVAICHREVAMYVSLFVGGLVYSDMRGKLPPISLRMMGLLLLPLLLDGTTHMLDDILPWVVLRGGGDAIGTFNWWLRMLTGVLFAVAVVLGIYPRLDRDLRGLGVE